MTSKVNSAPSSPLAAANAPDFSSQLSPALGDQDFSRAMKVAIGPKALKRQDENDVSAEPGEKPNLPLCKADRKKDEDDSNALGLIYTLTPWREETKAIAPALPTFDADPIAGEPGSIPTGAATSQEALQNENKAALQIMPDGSKDLPAESGAVTPQLMELVSTQAEVSKEISTDLPLKKQETEALDSSESANGSTEPQLTGASGKEPAKTESHMKFGEGKNKIAAALNKTAQGAQPSATSETPLNGERSASPSPRSEIAIPESSIVNWLTLPSVSVTDHSVPIAQFPPVDTTARQVERLGNLIQSEVITFKITGAHEMAVSLKIDAQTELFLGLTQRDGQIQASLRCDSGHFPGLQEHFAQLQETLARFNVQLLPMENTSSDSQSFHSPSQNNSSFQQSQEQQKHESALPDFVEEFLSAPVARKSGAVSKAVKQFVPEGWQTWA